MHSRIAEIQSYLDHHDYSLAMRRILDASFDSGHPGILLDAIHLSRQYRSLERAADTNALNSLLASASSLLLKIDESLSSMDIHRTRLLLAKNISKTYSSGNFSLQPITFEIHTGDVLGIVGQNGHGKTTLLRCLAGQLAIDGGDVSFPQLGNPDLYDIKHHVAFIPQRIPRWHGLLKDNLHFSASLSGIKSDENELMVDFMVERLGLGAYAHLTWEQISSGYRTRFELARILLQRPRLLILDEPLANLDINAQQSILTDLRFMAKSFHSPMGILLSSQQLHEVEKIADTVLLIKKGVCLFRTGDQQTSSDEYVVEVETPAERETLAGLLADETTSIHFNGGFYTITSSSRTPKEIISNLIAADVPVNYFRDITHSTKRFI